MTTQQGIPAPIMNHAQHLRRVGLPWWQMGPVEAVPLSSADGAQDDEQANDAGYVPPPEAA